MPRKRFPANVVGPQIRKARYQLGLSQSDLAARCQLVGLDISRATLAQIEIRFRRVTDGELLILASLLNVSTDDLFPLDLKKRLRSRSKSAKSVRSQRR
jgi:transcriptional regulator with XRE-family HTH domain